MPSQESYEIRSTLYKPDALNSTPLHIQRQEWEESALKDELPQNTQIDSVTIAGIPCEQITCGTVDTSKLMIHLHGGGFILGSCITHRKLAAHLSLESGLPVLLIDYRLAPEHPFPEGLEDVAQVYRKLIESKYSPSQIILSGDSAGGGLVVSSLLMLRDANNRLPIAYVLISPMLDLALTGESLASRKELDPLITDFDLRDTVSHYAPSEMFTHPLVSPIYADLKGLPPCLIHVGDHEVLLSDSTRFATLAQDAGVDVTLDIWDDMWHVWHSFAPQLPEAQEALQKIGTFIKTKSLESDTTAYN